MNSPVAIEKMERPESPSSQEKQQELLWKEVSHPLGRVDSQESRRQHSEVLVEVAPREPRKVGFTVPHLQ